MRSCVWFTVTQDFLNNPPSIQAEQEEEEEEDADQAQCLGKRTVNL